jgi:hypothetical protein
MSDQTYTEADLAPERQLQHIKNLQRQMETLYELVKRQEERIEDLETRTIPLEVYK